MLRYTAFPLTSALQLFVLDFVFRKLFQWVNLSFPSSLAGCGALFVTLLLSPPSTAVSIFQQLQPGAVLLAKWLPVFFVPSLVTLPLSSGLGSLMEWIKVGTVVVGGFLFTLLTTAWSVVLVSQIMSLISSRTNKNKNGPKSLPASASAAAGVATLPESEATVSTKEKESPFSNNTGNDDEEEEEVTMKTAMESNVTSTTEEEEKDEVSSNEIDDEANNTIQDAVEANVTLIANEEEADDVESSIISTSNTIATTALATTSTPVTTLSTTTTTTTTSNNNNKGPFSNTIFHALVVLSATSGTAATVASYLQWPLLQPMTMSFFLFSTLASFVYGTRLPKRFTKFVHPLITCTTLTWMALATFALFTAQDGSSFYGMLRLYRTGRGRGGAGDWLLYCLGPAVVSLAVSMYEKRQLMRDNLVEVGTAIGTSTLGGLFGTAVLVRWLEIGEPTLRLAMLSRNITSPLAMAMASLLGADVSLAVSAVVVTGLLGANFGASILDAFRIRNVVARGMGIGASAHGLGTAAIVNEPDAFPFAAIAMALTASAATVTVSIPFFRRIILELALGWY